MEFCEICDNLLYLRAEEDNSLIKYCKHCTFSKKESASGNNRAIKVSQNLYSEDDLLYLQYQNKYLRFDPTLPRVTHSLAQSDKILICPDASCKESKQKPQTLYVKYHPVHMKYLYCCDYCGITWREEDIK
jgi:DNA-directed RNA polymerase subunit M/transcription elongation factor TFIIS|uniref:DNA-directed RNA polymerase M/15kDa subunit domain-containing protein n=1 Tax=viral metagenome TaxID=1070528 RepID=A0A6C0KT78_9ZZZZ